MSTHVSKTAAATRNQAIHRRNVSVGNETNTLWTDFNNNL
jgi:hypothetical protein